MKLLVIKGMGYLFGCVTITCFMAIFLFAISDTMAKRLPDGNPVTPDSTIWATIIILILSGLVSMLLLNKSEKMEKKRRHRQISHAANVKCICQRSFEATFTKLDVDLGGKQLICPFCKSQFWHSLKSSDSSIFFKAGNQEFTDFVELALK